MFIAQMPLHGTDDPLIPYDGGAMAAGTLGGNVLPVS
jgi:poly(3-hydroxybutyrate) depolymerase